MPCSFNSDTEYLHKYKYGSGHTYIFSILYNDLSSRKVKNLSWQIPKALLISHTILLKLHSTGNWPIISCLQYQRINFHWINKHFKTLWQVSKLKKIKVLSIAQQLTQLKIQNNMSNLQIQKDLHFSMNELLFLN